jgi:hypothetical protein
MLSGGFVAAAGNNMKMADVAVAVAAAAGATGVDADVDVGGVAGGVGGDDGSCTSRSLPLPCTILASCIAIEDDERVTTDRLRNRRGEADRRDREAGDREEGESVGELRAKEQCVSTEEGG